MANSVWTESIALPRFQKLQGDIKTDVLIIGGGMCGLLCAHFLKAAGIDYVLAEAGTIGSGITKNTTAKITSQHGLIYGRLIKSFGTEKAKMYLQANEAAKRQFRNLAEKIDCDFEEKAAYTYSLKSTKAIEDEVRAVNSLGFPAELCEHLPLPFETFGAVKFPKQAQFHPLKFIAKIAQELRICEHTFIRDISGHTASSDTGSITADKIIVTTHFPFLNTHGSYFLKLYQHRSYVLALENAPYLDGMYVDEAQKGMSFRNYGHLLFLGGGDHRTGKRGGTWQELRKFAAIHYPRAKEKYAWATQDCMSLDGIPYIGHYSRNTPYLYTASGFNKWGMTSSMAAAMILCDLINGCENEWAPVFSPSRSILHPQLFVNTMEAVLNLLTPVPRRCPHMGCALKWNSQEHTWDCPCHGSRFHENGALIDNPATGGAHVE